MNVSSAHHFPLPSSLRAYHAGGEDSVSSSALRNTIDSNNGVHARDPQSRSSPLAPLRQASSGADVKQENRRSEDADEAAQRRRQAQEEQIVQDQIKVLAARDREVRAHEQAHMAAGGQYAGAATYEFERGPNGVSYAVGGEVPISTSEEATPEATLRKAQIIRRAALAPAEPSPQDRRVAAMASQMESAARAEIAHTGDSEADKADEIQSGGDAQAAEKSQSSGKGDDNPLSGDPAADQSASRDRLQRRISSHDGTESRKPGALLSLTA